MSQAATILAALGGANNVETIEPCITRLRVEVVNPALIDEKALTNAGAFGVVQVGKTVQVVVGPTADNLADEIAQIR